MPLWWASSTKLLTSSTASSKSTTPTQLPVSRNCSWENHMTKKASSYSPLRTSATTCSSSCCRVSAMCWTRARICMLCEPCSGLSNLAVIWFLICRMEQLLWVRCWRSSQVQLWVSRTTHPLTTSTSCLRLLHLCWELLRLTISQFWISKASWMTHLWTSYKVTPLRWQVTLSRSMLCL
jgi:hypothetical protein